MVAGILRIKTRLISKGCNFKTTFRFFRRKTRGDDSDLFSLGGLVGGFFSGHGDGARPGRALCPPHVSARGEGRRRADSGSVFANPFRGGRARNPEPRVPRPKPPGEPRRDHRSAAVSESFYPMARTRRSAIRNA